MNRPGPRIAACLGKAALKTHALQTLTRGPLTRPEARSVWSASDLSALSLRRGRPARYPNRFKQLLALSDRQQSVEGNSFAEGLLLPGRPVDVEAVDFAGVTQAEVERHGTLREITGLPVVIARVGPGTGVDLDRGAESIAIGNCANESDLQIMNLFLLGQVADQHSGMIIEVVGDNVQIAVVVQIKSRG